MNKFIVFAAGTLTLLLTACGGVKLPGLSTGSTDTPQPPPDDPVERAVQVGVTSARAQKCGYYFDPQQLRANFLTAEAQRTLDPAMLKKVETAHDFSHQKVTAAIAQTEGFCTEERTTEIKTALTRYLAGDFSVAKKPEPADNTSAFDIFGNERPTDDTFNSDTIHDPLLNPGGKKQSE
ncbi:MAG: hypothetical protein AAFW82_02705 [Pseudomonadota bacterium]